MTAAEVETVYEALALGIDAAGGESEPSSPRWRCCSPARSATPSGRWRSSRAPAATSGSRHRMRLRTREAQEKTTCAVVFSFSPFLGELHAEA